MYLAGTIFLFLAISFVSDIYSLATAGNSNNTVTSADVVDLKKRDSDSVTSNKSNASSQTMFPQIDATTQGAIVGGIIGFGSGIGTHYLKNFIDRPRNSIECETVEKGFKYPRARSHISYQEDDFVAIRIRVRNRGRTAAQSCKATLVIDKDEFRVAWMVPKDDHTVTINSPTSSISFM
jgi:hypothetical protein